MSALRRLKLLQPTALTATEVAVASMLLGALTIAVYGLHVVHGGFILDDWAYGAEYETYGRDHGVFAFAERLLSNPDALMSAGGRPVGAFYVAAAYKVFGAHMGLHLALAVGLACLVGVLLYSVLRTLGIERLHAGAIATLFLLFPAASSARLWPAGAVGVVAIAFYLSGLLLALAGLRTRGPRAWAFHAGALVFYALSLLQYEIAAAAIALTGLLYLTVATRRAAIVRWAADLTVVALALLYLRSTTTRSVATTGDSFERARNIQGQARQLLTQLGVQDGPVLLPFVVIAAIALIATVLAFVIRRPDPGRSVLRRWVLVLLGGAIAVGAGYILFAAAEDSFYEPLRPGIGNRTNSAAAVGFVVVLYALAVVVSLLLARASTGLHLVTQARAARIAGVLPVALALVLGVYWFAELNSDRRSWDDAYALNARTVEVLRADVDRPIEGSTIYTFGVPGETKPLVPAFTATWDLTGAVRMIWRDATLKGIPSASVDASYPANTPSNSGIDCSANAVRPRGWLWHAEDASEYGKTVFVDIPTREVRIIRTPEDCRRAVAEFLY